MSLILLALVATARADDPPPSDSGYVLMLAEARRHMLAKEWADARASLDSAEAIAPANDVIILPADLARLDFYRGVIEWYGGDRDQAALDAWRRAAVIGPDFAPDKELLPEVEAQDAFYAIASEVKGYDEVELDLPDDPGDATIFVDGARREVGDVVRAGTHYIQVRCEDGSLVGAWYLFGTAPPDWLAPCHGGMYPTGRKSGRKVPKVDRDQVAAAVPVKTEPTEPTEPVKTEPVKTDTAKTETAKTDTAKTETAKTETAKTETAKTEPAKTEPVKTEPVKTEPAKTETTPVATTDEPARTRRRFDAGAWVTVGTGAALLGAGAATEALVFEPLWKQGQAATEDPNSITATEATDLERRYDLWRYVSAGLLAGGGLTLTTGLVVGAIDAHLTLTPAGLSLGGRW